MAHEPEMTGQAAARRASVSALPPVMTAPHRRRCWTSCWCGRRRTPGRETRSRQQLIAYFHMWHDGKPAAAQCEGCTFFNGQVRELSYLHSRDVTYATFCQGPYAESAAY